jgi:type II secretory pathway pseudopilin PulG
MLEILIVIVIILILASVAYPVYNAIQERGRTTQDMNNLRQIAVATQTYLNDNDGLLFSTSSSWMSQLHPKYLPAWSIFQSGFDKRGASDLGDATTPVSYGINANIANRLDASKITNPSIFIVFAPAQDSETKVAFLGTPVTGSAQGVTVNQAASAPGGTAKGGTNTRRARISALFGDWHAENMLWSTFTTTSDTAQRWSP